MVVQVIGKERKQGEFTPPNAGSIGDQKKVAYDNTHLYCVYTDENVEGHKCEEYKIKTPNLRDQIEVGDLIEVYYNQYRKPETAVLVQKGDNK